jgi:radical SAM superfamily enzyme YgiQ (UPF0313 family)
VKVSLISPFADISVFGLRVLSACLKRAGHDCQLILLPQDEDRVSGEADFWRPYPAQVREHVAELCADSGLVGVTVMTNYAQRAAELSEAIRARCDGPIVWGGIHPTVRPDECLEHAPYICMGEGEEALVELADAIQAGRSGQGVANIWTSLDGQVTRSAPRPLIQDLDQLPLPDWDLDRHWILHHGEVRQATAEVIAERLMAYGLARETGLALHQTMSGRGCPFRCSYCCNDQFYRFYDKQRLLRFRSSEHILAELEHVRQVLPQVRGVAFSDDSMLAMPKAKLLEFCSLYKERVHLPIVCLTLPVNVTEEKIDALVDAGLRWVKMGIQTGSQRILELYQRRTTNEQVMDAARVLNRHAGVLDCEYDIIVDNPYETVADQAETLRLLSRLPRPFQITVFTLVFFPGTSLRAKAEADGLLSPDDTDSYMKSWAHSFRKTYPNLLLRLFNRPTPTWLLRVLSNRVLVRTLGQPFFEPLFRGLYNLARALRRLGRRLRGLPVGSPPQKGTGP